MPNLSTPGLGLITGGNETVNGSLAVTNGVTVSAGGLSVSSGPTSLQAATATKLKTAGSNAVFTNGVAATVASLTGEGTYLFTATNDGGGVAVNALAIVTVDGANNVAILAQWGSSGVFSLSGANVRYTQSSGVSQTVTWTYTLLA